ncbi:DUF3941 domain-containing protein [Peribacillus sp. SCS-155]
MSHTKDDDKRPEDNQARNEQKNILYQRNKQAGKHSYSKKTDHK